MKKEWKRRLLCGFFALLIASAEPALIYARADNTEAIDEAAEASSVSEEDLDAYFDGSVFVGDSVLMGFRNYAMKRGGSCLGRMQFLAAGSFSVYNALLPVSSKSVHPVYQGQQRLVWESLGMLQAKKVFLFFGLNDLNMGSLESTCGRYAQVIANIKAACPDAEIHIMSMTYTKQGKGKGKLNNPTIRQFNDMLRQMASDSGWGFVDIANPLADGNGDLAAAYCSDNYVHQTNAAYDVWAAVLREYAKSQLEGTSAFPATPPAAPEEETAASEAEETQQSAETGSSPVIGPQEETAPAGPGTAESAAGSPETETGHTL